MAYIFLQPNGGTEFILDIPINISIYILDNINIQNWVEIWLFVFKIPCHRPDED